MTACAHCGLPVADGGDGSPRFCCRGCRAAHDLIEGLGLDAFYRRRTLVPGVRPLRPDPEDAPADHGAYARRGDDGVWRLDLMVDGLHCAACVWLIESVLGRRPGVVSARLNMTSRRLGLAWRDGAETADGLAGLVNGLGYRAVPFDPARLDRAGRARERELLRALAVAGFAAANVMLLSVAVWAGHGQGMAPLTRDLLHWVSALIALPAVAYAGRPFFRSAFGALRAGRASMDVPISLAVVLAAAVSLAETAVGGPHAYFDSAVTLLFFLLIGRYLDQRARGRARSAAEHLLSLSARAATVVDGDGRRRVVDPSRLRPGVRVFVAAGERVPVDGTVDEGSGTLDTSLLTGESLPSAVAPGTVVYAGTLNLTGPLTVSATAVAGETLLAEIARLVAAAEAARGRYIAIAERVSRLYAPVVHGLALAAFAGWFAFGGADWRQALLIALAVLIITCPCALGLAVPAVQTVAASRLLRQGILVKSATALERLAEATNVVFDKTGTLTTGRLELVAVEPEDPRALVTAARLAAASRHPLARALVRAAPRTPVAAGVREAPGKGLRLETAEGEIRLGSRAWCGEPVADGDSVAETWLARPGARPVRFRFADRLREDAAETVAALRTRGLGVSLLSGDRRPAVAAVAEEAGIDAWAAECSPADKRRRLADTAGRRVVMVGDGLNDAPALAAAHASLSPASAAEVSQAAADVVFQGERLDPVLEVLDVARRARALVRQNLALAIAYNAVAVPLAVAGQVTPLVAAVAMSASSLIVVVNALRLGR